MKSPLREQERQSHVRPVVWVNCGNAQSFQGNHNVQLKFIQPHSVFSSSGVITGNDVTCDLCDMVRQCQLTDPSSSSMPHPD